MKAEAPPILDFISHLVSTLAWPATVLTAIFLLRHHIQTLAPLVRLHVKKNQKSQLFIDRHLTFRRDGFSSGGVDHEEIEANRFGAALLTPRSLVQQEIKRNDLDLDDEEAITFLAKRFHVSTAAKSNRLSNLGMLR